MQETGHFVAVAPLLHGWHRPRLPHFEKQEQVLTFLLRVRAFCPHISMWFGRTAGHGRAVKHGELCSAWTSKKARRGMLHAKRLKWARRLSRSSAAGVVHARSCSGLHSIWRFLGAQPDGRTSMNSSSSDDSLSSDEDGGRWWKTCLK